MECVSYRRLLHLIEVFPGKPGNIGVSNYPHRPQAGFRAA